jgi:uncharacterized phage protein (TIGR02220 family)
MATEPPYEEIIADLNKKRRGRRDLDPNTEIYRTRIRQRWEEGRRLDDFKYINSVKCQEWRGTEMAKFLKPTTLYAACHFEDYVCQDPDPQLSDAAERTRNSCEEAGKVIFDEHKD